MDEEICSWVGCNSDSNLQKIYLICLHFFHEYAIHEDLKISPFEICLNCSAKHAIDYSSKGSS